MSSLILLPGLLCDHALFQPQVDALSDLCAPWVADLTRDASIGDMARRVLNEVPAEHFQLVGLSMGGYVAQEICRQAPQRVRRLALLDTRARQDEPEETRRRRLLMQWAQSNEGFTPVTNRMLPLLIHPDRVDDVGLVQTIRDMAERVGVQAYLRQQQAIIERPDFRPLLRAIRCPTMLICGRQDVLTPLAFHEEMASEIPGAVLQVIEHCGHLTTLECPAEVNLLLRRWLRADGDEVLAKAQ